jgi:hypothetical protein
VSPEKNTLNNIEKSIMSMAASRKTKGQQWWCCYGPNIGVKQARHMEALDECG